MVRRVLYESLKNGSETRGCQTASMGRVMTDVGMKRKAMRIRKAQAKTVWTIHRCRVALRRMDEIHQPRMSAANAPRMSGRKRW
jgi:hypothetical protein